LRQTLIGYSSVPESTRVRGVERLPNADFAEYVPSLGTTPPWSCLAEDRIAGLGPRDLTKLGNIPYFSQFISTYALYFSKVCSFRHYKAQNLDKTLNPAQIFIATLRYFKMEGGYKSYSESLEAKYSRDSAKKAPECSAKGVKDTEESAFR